MSIIPSSVIEASKTVYQKLRAEHATLYESLKYRLGEEAKLEKDLATAKSHTQSIRDKMAKPSKEMEEVKAFLSSKEAGQGGWVREQEQYERDNARYA